MPNNGTLTRNRRRIGFLATLPALIVVGALMVYPVFYAIWISLLKTDGVTSNYIGLKNYLDIFMSPLVHEVLVVNLKFLISVPLVIFAASICSVLLFEEIWGWRFFRVIYFLPSILSSAVIGIVFRTAFSYDGPVNSVLVKFNKEPIQFFANANYSISIIIMALVWSGFGYASIILLSGLMAINPEVFQAAEVDGAGWWQKFWFITIPNIKGQLAFVTIINVLYTFTSLFGFIFVMTAGGPLYSTTTLDFLIYQKAFSSNNMGQGSALAILVFLLIASLTIMQNRLFKLEIKE